MRPDNHGGGAFGGIAQRIRLRPKIVAPLLIVGLLLSAGAYILLGELNARRVNDVNQPASEIVAGSLDREEVADALESSRREALALMIVGVALSLLAAYGLIGLFVTRPARQMASSLGDAGGAGATGDELALLATAVRRSLDRATPERADGRTTAAAIPDIRVLTDHELQVLDSQLIDGDDARAVALGLESLNELFPDPILAYLRDLFGSLDDGDGDTFEFSAGMREYAAEVTAVEGGAFILDVREIADDASESDSVPQKTPSEVIRDILGELPVVVIETDCRGVVRFVNRPPFGLRGTTVEGRRFIDIVPLDSAREAKEALMAAIAKRIPQSFVVERDDEDKLRRWINEVAVIGSGDSASIMIASVELPLRAASAPANPAAFEQQDKLWEAELRVSGYETEVQQLRARLQRAEAQSGDREMEMLAFREQVTAPLTTLYRAGRSVKAADVPNSARTAVQTIQSTLDSLAGIFDEHMGLSLREAVQAGDVATIERFHLPTLLDEIAIELGPSGGQQTSRIRVLVQPSLPKWVCGDARALRASINQMVEMARLVAFERPLVLTAAQEASRARKVQVRFSVQIPPPMLDDDALETLRACIGGTPDGDDPSDEFSDMVFGDARAVPVAHFELVTVEDQAAVLRCWDEFEVAEEAESDQSWVRGLRTLIIQDGATVENGIQPALSAFGIIGYVVTDEQDLIAALKIAEEYSNPYRLVLADVNTTNLEAFVSHLFDGDAPVVLVGADSESAMVGALSAGYNGYLAKPVRQVDLLEVILSTVEPPQHAARTHPADAA